MVTTFTYEPVDGSSSVIDRRWRMRELIGDTEEGTPLLDDAVIDREIASGGSGVRTQYRLVGMILASMARDVDKSVTDVSASRSQRFQQYKDLRAELRAQGGASPNATMDAGGVSIADDLSAYTSDFQRPSFSIGQFQDPRTRSSPNADPLQIGGDE